MFETELKARTNLDAQPSGMWERHIMALDDVTEILRRITGVLNEASVPYALIGGQAVALWVATKDPAAVRTTKDVDLLLNRDDLPRARAAALSIDMDYFELMGVGMFLQRSDPNPRRGVHLVWAGECIRPNDRHASPTIDDQRMIEPGLPVVSLGGLVFMKLNANRDQDRVHLRDMIEVGLIDRSSLGELPSELADRLDALLTEAGR